MNLYQTFIAKSRYCRYLPEQKRREHWPETVARYFDFMQEHLRKQHSYTLTQELRSELESAVTSLSIMPSMRALMTSGVALDRSHVAGYNCAYLTVDDVKAFDEAMYILLCGTGVGFSVERQDVSKLPEIPDTLFQSKTNVMVSDSKEGWAKALRQVIVLLYAGEIPTWDVSKVRKSGERLKTFGGRASGPEPLVELFRFVIDKFKGAAGRKLNSLECHDIMCKIGEVVVVGGVRRSAMISLSNLSDERMRSAKAGAWWEKNSQRALANNSVCYTEKPDVGSFMHEWTSLYESKSGERGMFNREASKKKVESLGRRDPNHAWGTNPCSEIILRPNQFCNLTSVIVRADDTEETLKRKVELCTILGTFQSTLTKFPYLRKIWSKNTEEERLLGVSLCGVLDNKVMSTVGPKLEKTLQNLRAASVETNKALAEAIGIQQSAAITCIKPEGTVSQLVDAASGMHHRHSEYYIRRVRGDVKDPLTQFMISKGVPNEPCVMRPDSTVVFSFPMKSPKGAATREGATAKDHLELWLTYQRHYCEHKPSITVSVLEQEWPEVGAWVWNHFDEISGVSFLPMDGGTYRQAPYENLTKEQYEIMLKDSVKQIEWSEMLEGEDNIEGAQMLACTAGVCEL